MTKNYGSALILNNAKRVHEFQRLFDKYGISYQIIVCVNKFREKEYEFAFDDEECASNAKFNEFWNEYTLKAGIRFFS